MQLTCMQCFSAIIQKVKKHCLSDQHLFYTSRASRHPGEIFTSHWLNCLGKKFVLIRSLAEPSVRWCYKRVHDSSIILTYMRVYVRARARPHMHSHARINMSILCIFFWKNK